MAMPISSPRRSRGAAAISQARPPVQASALPTPCPNRAAYSTHADSAKPKATLVATMIASPPSTVGRTPTRTARRPLGIAPASAPAEYTAERAPSADVESPNSSS
jgi:hypothetical protein